MSFLTGQEINTAISELTAGDRLHCAVAFWGKGSEKLIALERRRNFKIICNLKMGGTNPNVIKKMPRDKVRQIDTLHAKVYIGDSFAIVTSANASANGLGLEGAEQASWIEAAVRVDHIAPICTWFDSLWGEARNITDSDIENALVAWEQRHRAKPRSKRSTKAVAPSFAGFDTRGEDLPLIAWVPNSAWEPNEDVLKMKLGYYNKNVRRRIDEGIDIGGDADRKILKPGKWVLVWQRTATGAPRRGSKLSWVNLGQIIDDAFRYDGKGRWQAVALSAEVMPPSEPFNICEDIFAKSFREVLSGRKYEPLWTNDYEGDWFTPQRLKLIRTFWRDLKAKYLGSAES